MSSNSRSNNARGPARGRSTTRRAYPATAANASGSNPVSTLPPLPSSETRKYRTISANSVYSPDELSYLQSQEEEADRKEHERQVDLARKLPEITVAQLRLLMLEELAWVRKKLGWVVEEVETVRGLVLDVYAEVRPGGQDCHERVMKKEGEEFFDQERKEENETVEEDCEDEDQDEEDIEEIRTICHQRLREKGKKQQKRSKII